MKVHLFKTTKKRHMWELIGLKGGCFNRITCLTCGENRTTAYSPGAEWLQPGCYRIALRNRLCKGDLLIAAGQIGEYMSTREDGNVVMRLASDKYLQAAPGKWERWH